MDSSRSLPSTGRSSRGTSRLVGVDGSNNVGRKLRKLKSFEKSSGNELDGVQVLELSDDSVAKKRCAWVTPNSGEFVELPVMLVYLYMFSGCYFCDSIMYRKLEGFEYLLQMRVILC